MGSGGAKKTNQLLGDVTNTAAQRSAEIYGAGRGDIDWARGELKGLYSGLGANTGGGGGGGGGYAPATFADATMEFWKNLMNTGGLSEADKANILSYSAAPIRGMYDAMKGALQRASAGAGVGGGYTSGLGSLLQDKAYQGSELAKGVAGDLAQKVLEGQIKGATGLEDIEVKRRAFEAAERARRAAAAGAAASRSSADLATKRSLINQILGLEGDKDLAYMDRQLGSINARRSETPLWQSALASVVPAAGSAAVGAFTGGSKGGGGISGGVPQSGLDELNRNIAGSRR